jgi:hypothetical protein
MSIITVQRVLGNELLFQALTIPQLSMVMMKQNLMDWG